MQAMNDLRAIGSAEGAPGLLTIDLSAIQANWRRLNGLNGDNVCGAVVKADAYGLGLGPVAETLWKAGARRFYVAQSDEGARLRAVLPDVVIVVLAPVLPYGLSLCRDLNLVPTLNGPGDLQAWQDDTNTYTSPLPANLHIDTGMTRLGFDDQEFPAVFQSLSPGEQAAIVEVSSHLACADAPPHPLNAEQTNRFQAATSGLPKDILRSFPNSSGLFLNGLGHYAARPGMALYGLNPTPGKTNPMQPAVSLAVRILQMRSLTRNKTVGYGATVTVKAGTRIATIAAGYADGLHRSISGAGRVWIGGEAAPILGRVSMDLIAVDVSHMLESHVVPGGWAEVIGPNQSTDDLAATAGTIGYEMLTSLSRRYARRYLPPSPKVVL